MPLTLAAPPGESERERSDPWTIPPSVRERFAQDGHRFYFPDGALAFRDRGRKLITPSENTEVIRGLVEIAQARAWNEITVRGTERFRQEAWRQARLAGIAVRGYRPTEAERAQMQRSVHRREHSAPELSPSETQTARANSKGAAREPKGSRREDRLITGRLMDHAREPYRFDPLAEMSYFVRIQTPQGPREIWGKDLERALEKSLTQPQVGDEIGLRGIGQDPVTVKRREHDGEGRLKSETDLDTHRNRWVIEKRSFFEARAAAAALVRNPQIDPRRAVEAHPELAGTYLELHAASLAARRLRDPEERERFVAEVRRTRADRIERGDPLRPVQLREKAARRSPGHEQAQVPG